MRLLNDIIPTSDRDRFARTGESAEDYFSKQKDAMDEAKRFLQSERQFAPSAKATIRVQEIIVENLFGRNADIAGKLRRQDLFTLSESGDEVKRVSPDFIYSALSMRRERGIKGIASARTTEEKIRVAIDNHVALRSIQPFEDANSRTAAVILEFQLSRIVKHPVEMNIDGTRYREAVWSVLRYGDCRDLDFIISNGLRHAKDEFKAKSEGETPEFARSPYRETRNTNLILNPGQIEKLSEADKFALCFNSKIKSINGFVGENPIEGVYHHPDLTDLSLEEFKKTLMEGYEAEQKFASNCNLKLVARKDIMQTAVLKRGLQH